MVGLRSQPAAECPKLSLLLTCSGDFVFAAPDQIELPVSKGELKSDQPPSAVCRTGLRSSFPPSLAPHCTGCRSTPQGMRPAMLWHGGGSNPLHSPRCAASPTHATQPAPHLGPTTCSLTYPPAFDLQQVQAPGQLGAVAPNRCASPLHPAPGPSPTHSKCLVLAGEHCGSKIASLRRRGRSS